MAHNMIKNMIMIKINIHEAKIHLSRYLKKLQQGERIIICNRNVPLAELRAVPQEPRGKRPVGLAKGEFSIGPEFHEPLPPEIIESFDGPLR